MEKSLFLKTCAGEVTSTKPVWMMRQAGRYLPEYREMRAKFPNFLEFVANPEAAAEVTVQPLRRFDLDAAILFSDILVVLAPMGISVEFISGKGPQVKSPVQSYRDIQGLSTFDSSKELAYTRKAIELTKQQISKETPLLGFVGGPLTVASYAIEGQTSKALAHTKRLYYQDPGAYHEFLDKMATDLGTYLSLQADWGCDALVIMDSWAGALSAEDYQKMAYPYTQKLISIAKKAGKPIIHYANGAGHLIENILQLEATAFGLDFRNDLSATLNKNPNTIFQGNLEPALLFAPVETIQEKTLEILEQVNNRPHLMNLGHCVLQETPLEVVQAFIKTIKNYKA